MANRRQRNQYSSDRRKRVLEAFADLKEDTCVITHGGVIAIIMENLFPNEDKNRYQWQPAPGMKYVINGCYYNKLPVDP